MDTIKKVTIICWTVSALALLGLVIWFIVQTPWGNALHWETGPFQPVGTHSIPTDNITSLQVADWRAGAVIVRPHDGSEIEITEFSIRQLSDDERLRLTVENGSVIIHFAQRAMQNNMPPKTLEVLIPHELSESLAALSINATSGRVDVVDINAAELSARSSSGAVRLYNITSQNLAATTTSGSVELFNVYAEQTNLQSSSGNVLASNTQTQDINARTTSGRIELSGSFEIINVNSSSGRIEVASDTHTQNINARTTSGRHNLSGSFTNITAHSSSGNISVTSATTPESINARATSGNITVTVPSEEPISVRYSVTSGRFTSGVPVVTHSADAQFNLATTSGRISIYELR